MSANGTKPDWQSVLARRRNSFIESGFVRIAEITNRDIFFASFKTLCEQFRMSNYDILERMIAPSLDGIESFTAALSCSSKDPSVPGMVWGSELALLESGCRARKLNAATELLINLNASIPRFDLKPSQILNSPVLQNALGQICDEHSSVCFSVIQKQQRLGVIRFFQKITSASSARRLQQARFAIANFKRIIDQELADSALQAAETPVVSSGKGKNGTEEVLPEVLPKVTILPQRLAEFIEREVELKSIHHALERGSVDNTPRLMLCTISGMGGIGKTEIALEYSHRNVSSYDIVCWIRAEDEPKRVNSFCRIGKSVGLIPKEKVGDLNDVEKIREWLEVSALPWLLVFDNVLDFKEITNFLPSTALMHGSVLITTQKTNIGPEYIYRVPVEPFGPEDGAHLLFQHISLKKPAKEDIRLAKEISSLVDGLPLYLATIGGYIKQSGCTLSKYIETFNESRALWEGKGASAAWRYEKAPRAVFDIALDKLPLQARELLNLLAFLSPDATPDDLLIAPHEDDILDFLRPNHSSSYNDMSYDLRDRNLVKRGQSHSHGQYFSTHRTVQQIVLHKLSNDERGTDALERAFKQAFLIIRRVSPPPSPIQVPLPSLWYAYEKSVPHILSLLTAAQRTKLGGTVDFARLLSDAGMNLWERGFYRDGIRLLLAAEEILDALGCDEFLLRANIHIILALLIDISGIDKRVECERRLKIALDIRVEYQKTTPFEDYTRDDDVLLHNALSDYAWAMLDHNKYQEAEPIFLRCFERYVTWGPGEKIPYEYAKGYHHMAFCRLFQGDFDEAIQLCEQGLHWVGMATARDSSISMSFKTDLGCFHFQRGLPEDIQKSLSIHREVLKQREAFSDKYGTRTIMSCYAIGAVYAELEKYDLAEYWMQEALNRENKGWCPEVATARTEFHLSQVLRKLGKDEQRATALENRSREVRDRLLPLDPLPGVSLKDELALFDHLQMLKWRFTSRVYLKYIQ